MADGRELIDKAKLRVIGGRKATGPENIEGSPGCRIREKTGSPVAHMLKGNPVFFWKMRNPLPQEE